LAELEEDNEDAKNAFDVDPSGAEKITTSYR